MLPLCIFTSVSLPKARCRFWDNDSHGWDGAFPPC